MAVDVEDGLHLVRQHGRRRGGAHVPGSDADAGSQGAGGEDPEP